jgi:pilus assembly protein Flp/PilA
MLRSHLKSWKRLPWHEVPVAEEGQGLAEYGLILAGVAVLAIVAIFALGPKIGELLNRISSSL